MLSIAEMCLAYGDSLTYESVTNVLGAADDATNAAIVSALLSADAGRALEEAERMLSEGKSVGVLLRDLMSFLNSVAIAKSCRDAEKLLALPKETFAAVARIAQAADGAAILRATDILAAAETELRFASSPRISLETALLRIAMPREDLDPEALLVRIAALERQVAALPAGDAVSAPPAAPLPPCGKQTERAGAVPPEEDIGSAPADEPPPWELPPPPEPSYAPFEDAPFGAPEENDLPSAPARKAAAAEPSASERREAAPAPRVPDGGQEDPEVVFGQFLRRLRKVPKSGVLYTLCRDLAAGMEDGTLVLTTDVRMVAETLNGERHMPLMREVFAELGVDRFEVRYVSDEARDARSGLEQLKKDFSDYPIEIK